MIDNNRLIEYMRELDEIDDKTEKAGMEWAEANQMAEMYSELRKSVLARIVEDIKETPSNTVKAHNTLESMARAEEKYTDWIKDTAAYTGIANKKRVTYTKFLNRQKAVVTIISLGKELAKIR